MERAIISSPRALGKILGRYLVNLLALSQHKPFSRLANLKRNLKLSTMFCNAYSGKQAKTRD